MRAKFTLPQTPNPKVLQGVDALKEGREYIVLEVLSHNGGGTAFRVEFITGEGPALFDSRVFTVTCHRLPPTWQYFQFETGSFALRPQPWSQVGFWESYYEHEAHALEIYETEKQKILSSS
ncbi:hypothetical protein LUW75_13415 [Streptomyces sp. MRC013]|uniref:hypothetical protein n=1 Tax=Streptomyces sp. MRC013 TaxID=2898276 RepID=UPI002026ABBD|nr:hypothetical protein [Streptomyces sp. MRC013]URM90811.1 hypothetical protein LUW75_13415 [Streptomyces sp. MRC013]